jgi:5-methylcytosine-specific restriction protein A
MMRLPDLTLFGRALAHRAGIGISAQQTEGRIRFAPRDGDSLQTFFVDVTTGPGRIESTVHLGSYAGELLAQMCTASPDEKAVFAALVRRCLDLSIKVVMTINQHEVDASSPEKWPDIWSGFELGLVRSRVAVAELSEEEHLEQVLRVSEYSLLLVLSLAAKSDTQTADEEDLPKGLPEGAVQTIKVNRYERSRLNRTACIALLGDSCKACGIRMVDRYGAVADGLIHVHHTKPVSQLGSGYVIDPAKDLVPLCPNCHAVAHCDDPPLSVLAIRELLKPYSA